MNPHYAFETGDQIAILECYVDFITKNKDRANGVKLPFSLWKKAHGMQEYLIEYLGMDGFSAWEKKISLFQKEYAEELSTICPKFAKTFPSIVKFKIQNKQKQQIEFNQSVENALEEYEQKEFNVTPSANNSINSDNLEVSEIISLISSGATEIVSPSGWVVKVQS